MGASEKAVTAVMEARYEHDAERMVCMDHDGLCCPAGDAHDLTRNEILRHEAQAAADAAVDTDRPSIQAQVLREAAKMIRARKNAGNANIGPNGRALERRAIVNALCVKAWEIANGTDRIEARS